MAKKYSNIEEILEIEIKADELESTIREIAEKLGISNDYWWFDYYCIDIENQKIKVVTQDAYYDQYDSQSDSFPMWYLTCDEEKYMEHWNEQLQKIALEKERKEQEKREKELREKEEELKKIEEQERLEYERLKAKFEKKG